MNLYYAVFNFIILGRFFSVIFYLYFLWKIIERKSSTRKWEKDKKKGNISQYLMKLLYIYICNLLVVVFSDAAKDFLHNFIISFYLSVQYEKKEDARGCQ